MSDCITVKNLQMHYRGCEALKGIDLNIPTGSVFALLGENGAGKTTLIRILTGFQTPTAGWCTVLGMSPQNEALEIRRRIGYVSDAPALYDWMRIDEIGWFAASFYPDGFMNRYRESIEKYELPPKRKIKHLSKGQRAKVALSLALAHDPELLIMDEPTSGLDPLVRREFMESMVERAATGRTVLLSSHQISEVERVADHIAVIHEGRVKLSDELSSLRNNALEILVQLERESAALPMFQQPVEILSHERQGLQVRWVVANASQELLETLRSTPGVTQVRSRPATLEDLFVACTRGSVPKESNARNPNPSAWNHALQSFIDDSKVS